MKQMKKRICALCLVLLILPVGALAGGDWVDLLQEHGIRPLLEGSVWAKEDITGMYYREDTDVRRAGAVLETGNQRSLLLFEDEGAGWKWTHTLTDAVCQGEYCYVTAFGGGAGEKNRDVLTLVHESGIYTTEYYCFRYDGGQWEFECAMLYSYTGDTDDEDFYEQPKRVAYYTLENGRLKREYYLEDLYGKIPGAKLAQPGNGYWVKDTLEDEWVEWQNPVPITLENFCMADFPRDEYSLGWMVTGASDCEQKLGEPDSTHDYAVVNNPNPKDRLNLREAPDKSSRYMGKYYNGTLVRVLEQRDDGWVKVFLLGNDCVGYMRQEYLAFGEDMAKVANACPVFTAHNQAWELLYAPFDESNVKMHFDGGERFEVLGFVEGWWHIQVEDDTDMRGYIREYTSLK